MRADAGRSDHGTGAAGSTDGAGASAAADAPGHGSPSGPSGVGATPTMPVREAYRLWAPAYDAETAVTALDDIAARRLTPPLAGRTLLDAGCGTGRRLPSTTTAAAAQPPPAADAGRRSRRARSIDHAGEAGPPAPAPEQPALAVGVDLVLAMLVAGRRVHPDGPPVVNADLRAIPFADARFDVVWCRLALGHLPELTAAYAELARVCRPGGRVVVTGFHPDAARAGHTRTFRDDDGRLQTVEHFVHEPAGHERAALATGLALDERIDLAVGPEIRSFYERAGALDRYRAQRGLPLVLALRFRHLAKDDPEGKSAARESAGPDRRSNRTEPSDRSHRFGARGRAATR